jgi:hypothetical protein
LVEKCEPERVLRRFIRKNLKAVLSLKNLPRLEGLAESTRLPLDDETRAKIVSRMLG